MLQRWLRLFCRLILVTLNNLCFLFDTNVKIYLLEVSLKLTFIYIANAEICYIWPLSTLTRSYLKDKLNELINYYLLKWRQQRQHSYSEISNKDTFIILTIHKHNSIKFCVVYINVTVLHVHHNTIQGRGVQYVRYFILGTMKTNEFHTQ